MKKDNRELSGNPSIDKPYKQFYTEEEINGKLPEKTIYRYMYDNNIDHMNDVAINYFGVNITYKKIFAKIDVLSKSFKELGVKKGDIVTVCLPNIPEAAYTMYALNKIGAIVNFVHPLSTSKNFDHYIEEIGDNSQIIITYDGIFKETEKISDSNKKKLKKVINVSPTNTIPAPLILAKNSIDKIKKSFGKDVEIIKKLKLPKNDINMDWKNFETIGKNSKLTNDEVEVSYEKDCAAIMVHTGGTTGIPKGVLLSNDNYNCEVAMISSKAKFKRGDKMLGITPPFISYVSCNALHMPLVLGTPLIMIPEFFPRKFNDYIKKYSPQIIQGNPGYAEALTLSEDSNIDLSCLTYLVSGGDRLNPKLEIMINEFLKAHGTDIRITQGLGCTECTSCTVFTFEEAHKVGSVGIPLSHLDIKIIDKETGEYVGYNEPGEMWISGPTVMLGYYKNEEETNKSFRIFEDGKKYYNTRDILKMDEQGLLYYIGRTRGIILTQDDFNIPAKIFPSKVENIINTHESVKESCVIGVKHPDRIHIAKAYIKLKKGYKLENKELKEIEKICKDNLTHYELPYKFEQVDNDFPRTSIGKINTTLLEEQNAYNFYPELKKDKPKQKVLK